MRGAGAEPYLREFVRNWRALLAASLGLTSGYTIVSYVNNILVPPIMRQFRWSSADIALVGMTVFFAAVCQPISGRLTDAYGVKRVAAFGIACEVAIFLLYSAMDGSFLVYFLLTAAFMILVAATTTAVVYARVLVQSFNRAKGVALATAACSTPLAGAVFVPVFSRFIDLHGWREGYRMLALIAAIGGAVTLLLIPAHRAPEVSPGGDVAQPARNVGSLIRDPAFLPIVLGMLLGSLTLVMQTTQLKVILLATGMAPPDATALISAWAIGVVVGLLICGAALDRMPAYLVSAVYMALPGIGLLILATGTAGTVPSTVAVLFLGLTMGAEGNLATYLVSDYFPVETFSGVAGIAIGAIALSAALGSALLSLCLHLTGSFTPFLLLAAGAAFLSSLLFWRLKRVPAGGERRPVQH